jgi:hypothetical protein
VRDGNHEPADLAPADLAPAAAVLGPAVGHSIAVQGEHVSTGVSVEPSKRRNVITSKRRKGVTMLEVLLAVGILVPVMGMLYWFYGASLKTQEEGLSKITRTQLARVVLERIAREIRQANGVPNTFGPGIVGGLNEISIITITTTDRSLMNLSYSNLYDEAPPGQFDYREVAYQLGYDENVKDDEGYQLPLGLVRREHSLLVEAKEVVAPSELEGGLGLIDEEAEFIEGDQFDIETDEDVLDRDKLELYAPDIKFLEFAYFDGDRWWPDWEVQEGNALPQMIRVTVGFSHEPRQDEKLELIDENFMKDEDDIDPLKEDRFSMVVRIVQSDTFFTSRLTRNLTEIGKELGATGAGF